MRRFSQWGRALALLGGLCALPGTDGPGLAEASEQSVAAPQHGPWEWVRGDNGVAVHRRTVAGSPLHEFRGVGTIYAPIAAVLGVMNDTDHRLEWMKEAAAQILVEQVDSATAVFYNRTKAPWPASDRDAVLRATTTFDTQKNVVRIELEAIEHPAWPPQKGAVRMPKLRGHWYLWPEKGGEYTRAEYQVFANPGGSLPDWIINMVSKSIPHSTIVHLREQVKRRRYYEFEKKIEAVPEYQQILRSAQPAAPTPPMPIEPPRPVPPT
ncbi:MAG TPA: START domain-containing protein [Pseudomonadota bacterium]|nr:START domain-containing protein [Pseudomonadota bacterium]